MRNNKIINIAIIFMLIGAVLCAESVYALRPPLYYGKRVDAKSRLINTYMEMQKTWNRDSNFKDYFGGNRPADTVEEVAFVYRLYAFLKKDTPIIGRSYLGININEDGVVYLGDRKNDALTYFFKESLLWHAARIGLKWNKVTSIRVRRGGKKRRRYNKCL